MYSPNIDPGYDWLKVSDPFIFARDVRLKGP